MKSKIQKYYKYNLKAVGTKVFTALLCVLAFVVSNAQTSIKGKNKTTKYIDSVAKSKAKTLKSDKTVASDTIKKLKNLVEQLTVEPDSLFDGSGKFKFYKKAAHASYYADKFHNRRTASGKKYNKNKYSAAHKKLPFGTVLKITNEANGKSVIVEVTDRGPFVRSREIDLSKRAFMDIVKNKSSGSMNVTMEILQK